MRDENKANSMTLQKTFKKKIHARMEKTGESFSAARKMLLRLRGAGEPAADGVSLSSGDHSTPTSDLVPYTFDPDAEGSVSAEPESENESPPED